jgi:hypothetical protein
MVNAVAPRSLCFICVVLPTAIVKAGAAKMDVRQESDGLMTVG